MKAEDVKIGMKVKIVSNPHYGKYGHNQVGNILTITTLPDTLGWCGAAVSLKRGSSGELGDINCMYIEPHTFTKADLKTGMRLVYRNGARIVVAGDSTFYTPLNRSFFVRSFTEDLKRDTVNGPSQYDVMEVYAAPEKFEDLFNFEVRGELLFKREEAPVKTEKQKQAEELMAKAEELKAQFEALVKQATDLAGE